MWFVSFALLSLGKCQLLIVNKGFLFVVVACLRRETFGGSYQLTETMGL